MSADVVSQTVKVNVRFRAWTPEDIKHNSETEYELLTKRGLRGIDFIAENGQLQISKISTGVNFNSIFVQYPKHLVMSVGDVLLTVDGEPYETKRMMQKLAKDGRHKNLLRFMKNPNKKPLGIDLERNVVSMIHPENNRSQDFQFDNVFDEASQQDVFERLGVPVVRNLLDGFNAAVFMYGQTGSGKTYTMFGKEMIATEGDGLSHEAASVGLVPKCIIQLMHLLHSREEEGIYTKWSLEVTFLEVYRKKLANLLNPSKHQIPKLVFLDKEVKISNLPPARPRTVDDMLKLISIAASRRTVSAHNMNASSSRSHMIMEINLFTKTQDEEKRSKLVFADLAGSERVRTARTKGKSLKEAQAINSQLMHLREAIKNLSHRKRVQWRDSMLTQIMKPVLMGDNCLTSVIVCASKRPSNAMQTWDTLTFAQNAKKVEVSAMKNRKLPREELNRIIDKLSKEKKQLEDKLQSKAMELAIENKDAELEAALKRIEELQREILLFQGTVDRLMKENAQKDEINKDLRYRNGELKERIRDLEAQVEDVEHMEMAMHELEAQLGVVSEEKEELEKNNQILQQEINQSKELRDALSEMTERFATNEKQKSVQNDKAFSMLSTIDKLAEAQERYQQSVYDANKKFETERAEREKLAIEVERLRAKLEDRDEQVEAMQMELEKKDEQFEQQMTTYRREKEHADARIEALTGEKKTLREQKAEAHRRNQTLMETNKLKINDLVMRENEITEMRQEVELVKNQLEQERRRHREEFLEKQKELQLFEEQCLQKNEEQMKLRDEINNLNEIRRTLIARNESLEIHSEEEKQKLLQNIDEITNNLKAKEKDLEEKNEILEQTEAERDEKDQELETLWMDHRRLDEEKGKLELEKMEKEEEVMSLQQHLDETKMQLQETGAQLQDLQQEISDKTSALSVLEKEKEDDQIQIQEMELMKSALRQRQEIMREQEQQLEHHSAEAKLLREKLEATQQELDLKSVQVSSLKEHLADKEEQVSQYTTDLFELKSKQMEVETNQNQMEKLQQTQVELGNVRDKLEAKRVRVAELESGIDSDNRERLMLSERIQELELVDEKSDAVMEELENLRARLKVLVKKLELAEKEQVQHVLDVDRLERTERELRKARSLLEQKQQQLREAWRKGEEFQGMAIMERKNLIDADEAYARMVQREEERKFKVRQSARQQRQSARRFNESPGKRKRRNVHSFAPGMGANIGGEFLPSSPHDLGGIAEDPYPREGLSEIRQRPSASVRRPPQSRQLGNYKYTNEVQVGEAVRLTRPGAQKGRMKGVVKWLMEVPQGGYELGIRLEKPQGNSDGSHGGKRYFECEQDFGLFCNSSWITHVIRPNEDTGMPEKIRFENSRPNQRKRKASNRVLPEVSQRQRTRLRKVMKQNAQLGSVIERAYRSADTNRDGNIDKEEFQELCKRLKIDAMLRNPDFIHELWNVLDVNGDNKMDENEFERFISDFMINEISPVAFKLMQVKSFEEVSDDNLLANCIELCLQKRFDLVYQE